MIRLTDYARYYSKNFGVPLKSAMISDIPGWSWGMVPILARSGVEYLSFGNNSRTYQLNR